MQADDFQTKNPCTVWIPSPVIALSKLSPSCQTIQGLQSFQNQPQTSWMSLIKHNCSPSRKKCRTNCHSTSRPPKQRCSHCTTTKWANLQHELSAGTHLRIKTGPKPTEWQVS